MSEYAESLLNSDLNGFYYVRIGKEPKMRVLAFTTTYEGAEHIVNAVMVDGERAVIEEYSDTDLTIHIERRGNKV